MRKSILDAAEGVVRTESKTLWGNESRNTSVNSEGKKYQQPQGMN